MQEKGFILLIFCLFFSTIFAEIKQTPFWLTHVPESFVNFSSPSFPVESDVTIIGGGISGLSTAFWLKKLNKNRKITILEERGLCGGASGRNAGLLTPTVSLKNPEEIRNLEMETYLLLKQIANENNFQNNIDLHCFGQTRFSQTEKELEEIKSVHNFSSPGIEFWNYEKTQKESKCKIYNGGRFSKFSCSYSPTKYMMEIFKMIKNEMNIQTHTKVVSVEKVNEKEFILHTNKGKIKTGKVVYATNGYTSRLLHELKEIIYPVRGQIVATKPLDSILWKFIGSTNFGSEYYGQRSIDKRIILGGFRWKSPTREVGTFDDSVLNKDISSALREFLGNFEGLNRVEIDYEWTGIMGFTKDGRPLIGKLKENEFIISGMNGHGMPVIFGMAKRLASYIEENIDTLPKLFDPKRFLQNHEEF
jgi:gamma-glutamylputrescine oxidase